MSRALKSLFITLLSLMLIIAGAILIPDILVALMLLFVFAGGFGLIWLVVYNLMEDWENNE